MTSAIFLLEASLPALDGGVDRLYTKAFFFLVILSLSLTNTSDILIPPVSTTQTGWGWTRGRPEGIQLLTIKTLLTSDATWGATRVTLRNVSQAKTTWEKHFLT